MENKTPLQIADNPQLPPLPSDDAFVHIYPFDLERMSVSECTATAFSVAVGCPDGESVPVFTADQMREYALAARDAAQPAQQTVTCQIYGHALQTCGECNHELAAPAQQPAPAHPVAQEGWKQDLVHLLISIRPQYGAIGSRDVDVRKQQEQIDAAIAILLGQPAAQVPLSDERIVKVLASLGIDTYPSKYGFPSLQVSATSVPMIRDIVAAYIAEAGIKFPYKVQEEQAIDAFWRNKAIELAEKLAPYIRTDSAARPDADMSSIKDDIEKLLKLSDDIGRSRGPNNYAMNQNAVGKFVDIKIALFDRLDAMVAQPSPATLKDFILLDALIDVAVRAWFDKASEIINTGAALSVQDEWRERMRAAINAMLDRIPQSKT